MSFLPLAGIRIVSLAINLPGPAAAARLRSLGADITKVEPPSGDPLAVGAPAYYAQLVAGQAVLTLDLKDATGREALWELLGEADLLVTSSRPSALLRLGLDWPTLQSHFPRLCWVSIVGHPGVGAETAGHDLTYQATAGILTPPHLPAALVADLAGAERAVADGIATLLQRSRTGEGAHREVALSDVADSMAQPAIHGLTSPGGFLGGASPRYGIYPTASGAVAVAALEEHFWETLVEQLGVEGTRADLEVVFRTRTAHQWETWARERGLPLAAVRVPGAIAHRVDGTSTDNCEDPQ